MRESKQREHDEYAPYCKGRVEPSQEECYHAGGRSDGTLPEGLTMPGPWFCGSCDWEEGKCRTDERGAETS
jgi:hypothetical protein